MKTSKVTDKAKLEILAEALLGRAYKLSWGMQYCQHCGREVFWYAYPENKRNKRQRTIRHAQGCPCILAKQIVSKKLPKKKRI